MYRSSGTSGDDYFWITAPQDDGTEIEGSGGIDTLNINFRDSNKSLALDLSDGGGGREAGRGIHLSGLENLQARGSMVNDSIIGGDMKDYIDGEGGDDVLDGGAGSDLITDQLGNDDINGGAGSDFIIDHSGNDDINGGDGDDRIFDWGGTDTISSGDGNDEISAGTSKSSHINGGDGFDSLSIIIYKASVNVNIDLSDGGGNRDIGDGTKISNIEQIKLFLTGGDDTIIGTFSDDYIVSSGGGDFIDGNAGNDKIVFINQSDSIDNETKQNLLNGGAGDDTLTAYYYNISTALNVVFQSDGSVAGLPDTASAISFEHLDISGGLGKDRLVGGAQSDSLIGGDGNDRLFGAQGNDSLSGDAGNDFLSGGGGNDFLEGGTGRNTLSGGAGNDIYFYWRAERDVIIEAVDGGYDTIQICNGSFTLPANVEAAQIFFDDMGDPDAKVILQGNSLSNTFRGSTQNDVFIADGIGDDRFFGDSGTDTIDFRWLDGAVVDFGANANGGSAQGDQFFAIERVLGSLNGADTITAGGRQAIYAGFGGNDILKGGASDDRLWGGDGEDTLSGGRGNDILNGGAGADLMTGGSGRDVFVLIGENQGADRITDFHLGEDVLKFSKGPLTFTGNGSTEVTIAHAQGVVILDSVRPLTISAADLYFV